MRGHHDPLAWAATLLIAVAYAHLLLALAAAVLAVAVGVRLLASPARGMLYTQARRRRLPNPLAVIGRQRHQGGTGGVHSRGLKHVPTLMQLHSLVDFGGREPCSYLLDPRVNHVPELPAGCEDQLGEYGLCFTGTHADGCMFERVTLPNGWSFDLF